MILKLEMLEFRLNLEHKLNDVLWDPNVEQLMPYESDDIIWFNVRRPIIRNLDDQLDEPISEQYHNICI